MSLNRRQWLRGAGLLLSGGALASLPLPGRAAPLEDPSLQEALEVCTPPGDPLAAALERNRRFAEAWQASAGLADPQQRSARLARIWKRSCQVDPVALARGQKPWMAMVSCADSRVAADAIFTCGSGEIFEVACAGNTAFDEGIASLEYAVSVLGVTLILVMGHSGCGAVKAAMASKPLTPLLEKLVTPIRASLVSGDDLTQAIQGNARYAAAQLTPRSPVLRAAAEAGSLQIRSAFFDVATGLVTLL